VTESAYTEDSAQIIEMVKDLRSAGFRIEMDDFGSGYSSLNMLSLLPIDALKLDMQFIRSAFKERKDTRLLEMVIRLAESLEVPTIAEGVETAEQLLTLRAMGCDIVQGYYFSRPVPAAEFERFLQGGKQGRALAAREEKALWDRFTYEALHDPLTGLFNRSAFEVLYLDSDKEHLAVLSIAIHGYAALKEAGGFECADRAVQKTVKALRSRFRSTDYLCRVREDRFAVIVTRITDEMRDMVLEKVRQIVEALEKGEGDPAPVALSVGVAFSDLANPGGDIYHHAEAALRRLLDSGRPGLELY